MDAELQSLRMNPVRQRLESRPARRRREPARHRNQDPIRIPQILPVQHVRAEGILHVPPLVNHRVLPSQSDHTGQHLGVGLVIGLIDGQPVRIPTVPPHRRRRCNVLSVCLRGSEGKDEKNSGNENHAAIHLKTYTTFAALSAPGSIFRREVVFSRRPQPRIRLIREAPTQGRHPVSIKTAHKYNSMCYSS